jgi:potassium/hydrogen antiporter
MTADIIITICVLLLIAYAFDITSSRTRVPSVILLLFLGWLVRQGAIVMDIKIPDLSIILPVLGTVGLILILLESSMELELTRKRRPMIVKSFFMALLPYVALTFGLAWIFMYFGETSWKAGIINAIPLGNLSSAVAIPSVRHLATRNKEFVTYESNFSDVVGVLFFNLMLMGGTFGLETVGYFHLQIVIMAIISLAATIGLSLLLNKIEHHIKFAPIILIVVLIYVISGVYKLPGLIFILIFGLFLANFSKIGNNKWIKKLKPEALEKEVTRFKDITTEMSFIIRSLFFLLFGYLMETVDILNTDTMLWAIVIFAVTYLMRFIWLKIFRLKMKPLLFIAPKGLFTIILYLSIPLSLTIPFINKSLIIQIIILSALFMMFGLLATKKETEVMEEAELENQNS